MENPQIEFAGVKKWGKHFRFLRRIANKSNLNHDEPESKSRFFTRLYITQPADLFAVRETVGKYDQWG